jgi:two-component system phosphate regulon sensor histidine kinase PhoR
MRLSFFVKLFGSFCVIILGLTLLTFATSFNLMKRTYHESLVAHLEQLGTTLSHQVPLLPADTSLAPLREFAHRTGRELHVRMTVIDRQGRVLADSDQDPLRMEDHMTRPEIISAFTQRRTATAERFSATVQKNMLYVAVPVVAGPEVQSVVRVSMYEKNIDQVLRQWRIQLTLIALGLMLAALVAALLFTRGVARPMAELRLATTRVAAGNFAVRVAPAGHAELRDLAISFNRMTDELRDSVASLACKKDELLGILGSIREGLLVLDAADRVVLASRSLCTLTGQMAPEGRYYWEIIREAGFAELVQKMRAGATSVSGEIALGGRVLYCSMTRMPSRDETIVVLHDITELKSLEARKKEFIANVSHELRTPLTAIKGFTETLEEGLDPQRRHYVDIIKRHTNRLISIVQDILQLSQLEQAPRLMVTEPVDLPPLIENVAQIFKPRLTEKGLAFSLETAPGLPRVKGDAFKLEQLFINLIDNAVKYTDQGGVAITLAPRGPRVEVTVADTGIGIPPEHRDRIFERFYVVDRSRSRTTGGTGLGLSIVKHIVLLHQGSVEVVSGPDGKGTVFTVRLPAA